MKVTDFSAIPYAWYIEMWIGLFLLTPFLNILWKGVETKRHRLILIATLFVMTALPDFANRYGLYLMPGYWTSAAYPLIYFFLGCYIKVYQPVFKKKWLGGAIVGLCLINPLFNILFVHHHTMLHVIGGPGGIVVIPLTVLVFLMCYQYDVKSGWMKKTLERVSVLSLDMYLVSYIFDALYYPIFIKHFYVDQSQFGVMFFVIVPLVLLSSFVVAFLKSLIIR